MNDTQLYDLYYSTVFESNHIQNQCISNIKKYTIRHRSLSYN